MSTWEDSDVLRERIRRVTEPGLPSDLRERVPAHSLIEQLLHQWENGAIHVDDGEVVIDDEAQSWYQGVLGERYVARLLEEGLGPDYLVLHSVPAGAMSRDIDHVVIGPSGVFTINTKYSPGAPVWSAGVGMYVNKHPTGYVHDSIREVRDAEHKLTAAAGFPVSVCGVIVFVNPGRMSSTAPSGTATSRVWVIDDDALVPALVGEGDAVYSPDQLRRLAEVAARPTTWRVPVRPWIPGESITREFEALETAVNLGSRSEWTSHTALAPDVLPVPPPSPAPRRATPRARGSWGTPAPRPGQRGGRRRPGFAEKLADALFRGFMRIALVILAFIFLMAFLSSLTHH